MVNERSIQRDIDDIRSFLADKTVENGVDASVVYDRTNNCNCLKCGYITSLTSGQVLAICKMLLSSRAFSKEGMKEILYVLIDCCSKASGNKLLKNLISNEMFHYVEFRNAEESSGMLWDIGQAILAYSILR